MSEMKIVDNAVYKQVKPNLFEKDGRLYMGIDYAFDGNDRTGYHVYNNTGKEIKSGTMVFVPNRNSDLQKQAEDAQWKPM